MNPRCSYRPRLEPLEGRDLPAFPGSGFFAAAAPVAVRMPHETTCPPPDGTTPVHVTVTQNTATVVNLAPIFTRFPGLQHQDGLRLSILSNTNPALVRTRLSDSAITLTYVPGQSGTATIVVCATDADGVSVRQTLQVRVGPPSSVPAVVRPTFAPATPMPHFLRR